MRGPVQSRPSRSAQDRRSASREGFDDPGNCASAEFSHGLDPKEPMAPFSANDSFVLRLTIAYAAPGSNLATQLFPHVDQRPRHVWPNGWRPKATKWRCRPFCAIRCLGLAFPKQSVESAPFTERTLQRGGRRPAGFPRKWGRDLGSLLSSRFGTFTLSSTSLVTNAASQDTYICQGPSSLPC